MTTEAAAAARPTQRTPRLPDPLPTRPCPRCHRPTSTFSLICSECRHFPVLQIPNSSFSWLTLFLLLTSVITSVILFRIDLSPGPLYLVAFALPVDLFTVLFAHRLATIITTWAIILIVLSWSLWEAGSWYYGTDQSSWFASNLWAPGASTIAPYSYLIPIVLWLLATAYALYVGFTVNEERLRTIAANYFGLAVFLTGMWTVWSLILQQGLIVTDSDVPTGLYQSLINLMVFAPIIYLGVFIKQEAGSHIWSLQFWIKPPSLWNSGAAQEAERPPYSDNPAVWLGIIAGYIVTASFFAKYIGYVMSTFLPAVVGAPSVRQIELGWLTEASNLQRGIGAVLGCVSILLLFVQSIIEESNAEHEIEPDDFYSSAIKGLESRRAQLDENDALDRRALDLELVFIELMHSLYVGVRFTVQVVLKTIVNSKVSFSRSLLVLRWLARYLIFPVIAFSLTAILVIACSTRYQAYFSVNLGAPEKLWGYALTVLVLGTLLCSICFGIMHSGSILRSVLLAQAPLFVAGFSYVCISICGLLVAAFWGIFQLGNVPLPAARPGAVFLVNAAALSFTLVAASVAFYIQSRTHRRFRRLDLYVVIACAALVGLAALVLGIWDVVNQFSDAAR